MQFEPTIDQRNALQEIFEWWKQPQHPYLTLGGYAGTGKTSLMAGLRQILHKLNSKTVVAFCAYTGKASRVLDSTLAFHKARKEIDSVSTIHSLIYAPVINAQGQVSTWKRKPNLKADLIIVDEASMVDRDIWEDLLSFNIPILAVGDHGQLPPIKPGFNLMSRPDIRLETIHRQAEGNPIIKLSMMVREMGTIPVGNFGSGIRKLDRYDSITGSEVESMLQTFRKELMILVGFNTSRIKLNQQMRTYFGFESTEPVVGDTVICLKNNREKGIYNGMIGKIMSIENDDETYNTDILLEDGTVDYFGSILKRQFDSPTSLSKELKQKGVDLFDFGYALTVHKAQGSQAKRVLLFEERNKHMTDEDWRRWLYTGITRAENELTIVGT